MLTNRAVLRSSVFVDREVVPSRAETVLMTDSSKTLALSYKSCTYLLTYLHTVDWIQVGACYSEM